MELHNLKPAFGSTKSSKKRLGRGQGSGKGRTSTRGHNGAKSRSGYSKKLGFEGGQMPLQRRVPKFGFKNFNRIEYQLLNLDTIQDLINKNLISDSLDLKKSVQLGLIRKNSKLKILARGKISSKINIKAHKFTNSAIKHIETAGGTIEYIK